MKKLMMFLALGFSLLSHAQKQENVKPNDDEAKQKEHYNKALDLTNEESEKFWPFTQTFREQQSVSKQKIKTAQENLRKSKSKKEFIKALEEIDAQKIEMIKNRQQYLKNCYDFLGQDRTIKVMDLDKKGGRSKKKEEERHENEHHRRKKKRSREKSDK
jgi:hypothetical protein